MAQRPNNPFAAFKCRKLAHAASGASKTPAGGKTLSAAAKDVEASAIDEQPAAAPARRPAAKRKAAPLSKATPAPAAGAEPQPPPTGVPELLGDAPLRLILVGHNPSDHAWKSGHYYSNPSNWMWRLLRDTGIAPAHIRGAEDDKLMPADAGVGFVDVGCGVPGTASNQFSSAVVGGWSAGFYIRLADHVQRACESIGCTCGRCGAPAVVAFTGKRQFSELVNYNKKGKAKVKNIPLGPQSIRPQGWPLPLSTEVWVLTSTSGASPMTNADRKAPYQALADHIATSAACTTAAHSSAADGANPLAGVHAAPAGEAMGGKSNGEAGVEGGAGGAAVMTTKRRGVSYQCAGQDANEVAAREWSCLCGATKAPENVGDF